MKSVVGVVCAECEYYNIDPYVQGRVTKFGECRINPPSVFFVSGLFGTKWPILGVSDWCGKFLLKGRSK